MTKPKAKPAPTQKREKASSKSPGHPRDNHRAARMLAEALVTSDATVCEKERISVRTLQRYREALKTDEVLSRLFDEARQQMTQLHWAQQIDVTLSGAAAKLLELVQKAYSPDAETIQAVTGAVQSLAEIAMTRDMLAARLRESEPEQPPAPNQPPQPRAVN